MEESVSRLEGTYEQAAQRLNSMDANILSIRSEISEFRKEINSRFTATDGTLKWMAAGIGASWLTVILAVLFHH